VLHDEDPIPVPPLRAGLLDRLKRFFRR
jgi:hypothetical protein